MGVITVNGEIKSKDLGITLVHEHLFLDFRLIFEDSSEVSKKELSEQKINMENLYILKKSPYSIKDNLILSSEDLILKELLEFKKAGGKTIVEQTSIGLGRSPQSIRNVANLAGLNAVIGCGYYVKDSLPEYIIKKSEKDLISELISEIHYGVNETNIRPGIIGELGISNDIGDWEKKLLKVASKVQRETGLAISVHIQAVPTLPGFTGKLPGLKILNILDEYGAILEKVVICHTDAKIDLKYIKSIMDFGAYAEFDHVGKEFYIESSDFLMDRDIDRILALKELVDSNYSKNILISNDVCLKTDLISYGGFGYGHILNNLVPLMLKKGIDREVINTILVSNPRRLLDVGSSYM